jgi:hypothetical protein
MEDCRIQLTKQAPSGEQIAQEPHAFRRVSVLADFRYQRATGPNRPAQCIENAVILRFLQHFVRGEHSVRVIDWRALQSAPQFFSGITVWRVVANRFRHLASYI